MFKLLLFLLVPRIGLLVGYDVCENWRGRCYQTVAVSAPLVHHQARQDGHRKPESRRHFHGKQQNHWGRGEGVNKGTSLKCENDAEVASQQASAAQKMYTLSRNAP